MSSNNLVEVKPKEGGSDAPATAEMSDDEAVQALLGCNALKVKQKASFAEAVTNGCCEKQNKYKIKAKGGPADGKTLYKAKEKSEGCQRMCCAPGHEATVQIEKEDVGKDGEVAYTMYKPFKCLGCYSCLDICRSEMVVYRGKWEVGDAPGEVMGSVKEVVCGGIFTPTLDVFNGKDEKVGQMKGPTCCIGSCCDTTFKFIPNEGESDAKIKKDSGDLAKELLTDADTFKISFDDKMDEGTRATLMGTQLLLDFMFFEDDGALDITNCSVKLCDMYFCGRTQPCKLNCGGGGDEGGGD